MSDSKQESLTEQLKKVRADIEAKVPPTMLPVFDEILNDLITRGVGNGSKKVGDKAPLFELPNFKNEKVKLSDVLTKNYAIINFYRGPWCPYCVPTMKAHQRYLAEYTKLGAKFIAISPTTPTASEAFAAANELKFEVLSDVGGKVASAFAINYTISETNLKLLQGFGVDLKALYGSERADFPLSATFVVDKGGVIRYAFVSTEWRVRADPNDIIAALRKVN